MFYKTEDGAKKETPTDELNIQPLDRLAEKVSRIYEKGMQVNFDKFSRIQPLDAPIRAEWFGVESFRRVGAVSRKTEYRISVLDEETLRALENKKKAGRRILTQLSYPLGDDQRWMPEKVRPLFEKEFARLNNEGREQLNKALHGEVDNFVKSRREQVIKDANLMYQEFHPGEDISEEIITKILDDLKERLNKAFAGKFIPEVNYNRIGFHFQRGSDWFPTGASLYCYCKK